MTSMSPYQRWLAPDPAADQRATRQLLVLAGAALAASMLAGTDDPVLGGMTAAATVVAAAGTAATDWARRHVHASRRPPTHRTVALALCHLLTSHAAQAVYRAALDGPAALAAHIVTLWRGESTS